MVVIFGASGHAKEVVYILRKFSDVDFSPAFLIANADDKSIMNIPVLSEDNFLNRIKNDIFDSIVAYVAIGNNKIRNKVVEKFIPFSNIKFPNLIANNVEADFDNILLGNGNIFFPGSQITTDLKIGSHNHFNLNVSISHDGIIGNYNSFSPGVKIAGEVNIGDNNFFGINASVIDKVSIGDNVIVGAGAVVIKNIIEPGIYVGVPAKKIK